MSDQQQRVAAAKNEIGAFSDMYNRYMCRAVRSDSGGCLIQGFAGFPGLVVFKRLIFLCLVQDAQAVFREVCGALP